MIIHTVKSGDTLFSIAKKYGVELNTLINANALALNDSLAIGQNIIVPTSVIKYKVKNGDTLYGISKYFQVPIEQILLQNPEISNPNSIAINQTILIPQGITPSGEIEVNGYAIANINIDTLNKTLFYLTYLAIFSYQIKDDGSLYTLYEQNIIDLAKNAKTAPLMVVTNIGASGGFDSDLVHIILTNTTVQNKLINNIILNLQAKGYYGVDIDFEFIYPYDKLSYIVFLKNLKVELKKYGYYLSVAVAPKYRDNQAGVLYEAHDYKLIGEVADKVIIMTYEWGYLYGPPQAIAPYNEVRQVIDYATTRIPSNKILMGVPNYAYDWTLPYVSGSAAMTLTNNQALALAIKKGSTIKFDLKAKSPYFYYIDELKQTHIVWFEDALSYQAKMQIVKDYDLAGVSIWQINSFYKPLYEVISANFNIANVI